ncbi:MAG: thiamine-phosphate kinase [Acidobacteria bacterium]|nr:thiamine-phosphate kinase [Acidobacteriota bacterium]
MSTPSSVAATGEHALIDLIRTRVPPAPSWVALGIGDDAAVVEPEPRSLDVFTTDALVDGVHFDRAFTPPDAIGHRALAVNLSDLAAMGARPRVALLSLILPDDLPLSDLTAIVDGLLAAAARHKVALVGGNITRTPGPLCIDVTAVGSVHRRKFLTRSGARPGDEVWVSGQVGSAAAGLESLGSGPRTAGAMTACEEAYLRPEPRIRLGLLLAANRAASACVDLSDGLADGLHQIASASKAGIVVDAQALPVSTEARAWFVARSADPVMAALCGGDDYELLFTVGPRQRSRLRSVRQALGDLPLTRIGTVTASRTVRLKTAGGACQVPAGYEHFR